MSTQRSGRVLVVNRIVRDLSGSSARQIKDIARCRRQLGYRQHFIIYRFCAYASSNTNSSIARVQRLGAQLVRG